MAVPLKIFIAGGSGFIGRHLIKAFRAHGHEVYGLARDRGRGKILEGLGCAPIVGNLLTNGPWERAIEKFDVAIGCTRPGKRDEWPAVGQIPELLKSHTDACSHLIQATHDSKLRGVILTFGVLCYGDHGEEWVDEDTPFEQPVGFGRIFGPARHALEHLAGSNRVRATFMVPGWVYSSTGWFKDNVLPAMDQGQARIGGGGENYMSFVHGDDLAEAYVLAAEELGYAPPSEDRPVTQVLNVVDDEPVKQKDFFTAIAKASGKPVPSSASREEFAKQTSELWMESFCCSGRVKNEKIKAALGWKLRYPTVREGVPAVLDAIKKER
jgi:nucleoside-diphosphate-sugar epimerase